MGFYFAGNLVGQVAAAGGDAEEQIASRFIAHGIVGGLDSLATNGQFGSGFLAAGVGSLADSEQSTDGVTVEGLVTHAIAGGIGSEIGGGSFQNGAITGTFGYLFNYCAHNPCIDSGTANFAYLSADGSVSLLGFGLGVGATVGQVWYADGLNVVSQPFVSFTTVPTVGGSVALSGPGVNAGWGIGGATSTAAFWGTSSGFSVTVGVFNFTYTSNPSGSSWTFGPSLGIGFTKIQTLTYPIGDESFTPLSQFVSPVHFSNGSASAQVPGWISSLH